MRTRVISVAAQVKCNVCGFDFAGCGDSGGEYVSQKINNGFLHFLKSVTCLGEPRSERKGRPQCRISAPFKQRL